jgi:hypothetical protein
LCTNAKSFLKKQTCVCILHDENGTQIQQYCVVVFELGHSILAFVPTIPRCKLENAVPNSNTRTIPYPIDRIPMTVARIVAGFVCEH